MAEAPAVCPVHHKADEGPKPIVAVTGASRGIGHAIVRTFHAAGWEVFTLARTPFSNACPWAEGIIKHIEVDLGDEASIRRTVHVLEERLQGRGLKALVNNAGISPKDENGGRLGATKTTPEIMQHVMMVNLIAPLMLTRGLLEPLKQAQGSVVNVSSIASASVHPFAGAAYATSKAALSAMTRELAFDLGETGVRVNAVAPGEIATSILSPGTDKVVAEQVPLRRLGSPQEVAEVVLFLCSSAASYVNGTEIQINGGQHV
jgi:NAD(P)-dependent dehydrogenase (short-subunit alcohol dehydrogenase family)